MPRRYYRSSSFKMALLFTVLLSLSGLLLGYFLYDFGRQSFERETKAAIDSEIEQILLLTEGDQRPERIRHIAERAARDVHPVYAYHDDSGEILAGNISQLPADAERLGEGLIRFRLGDGRQFGAEVYTFADGDRLLVGRDISELDRVYQRLRWVTGLVLTFMVLVIVVSFLISTYVVRRINRIAGTSQQIMQTGDLSRRLDIDSNWDDLSYLAETLNAMLDRIESLMNGIREVSNNIAHDLRTPLTRLRNRLETLQRARPELDSVAALIEECDGLLATFGALLRIANLEQGGRSKTFGEVDPSRVLRDVIELYDPLAESRELRIEQRIIGMRPIRGDRELLFQLFANLLDNAIKFSPAGGRIEIALEQQADAVLVTIADQGPGVAAADRERVFDRFFRADQSRQAAGSGLGLSLVKAILDLHRGRIELGDNSPGLRIRVLLPA